VKQVIISIGREFGSGGHTIAENIANRFELPLYDYNLLMEVSIEKNIDVKKIEKYDEIPKNKLFSRRINGYSNSLEENIANMQFNFLRKMASKGKSYVIVGRCAETILKEYKGRGLITIFILGDKNNKIERIANLKKISYAEAENLVYTSDKKRKAYHNYYCKGKWGDSRNYDFSINSSRLGIEETTDVIEDYIKRRLKHY